jgi:hypothetical protein
VCYTPWYKHFVTKREGSGGDELKFCDEVRAERDRIEKRRKSG